MLLANALESGFGQVIVFAGATLVASAFTWGAVTLERRRKSTSEKIDRMYIALVGGEVSDTDPLPAIGLIRDFAEQKAIIADLVPAVSEIQEDIKALVADSKPNGGSTSRDALNRIEVGMGTTPEPKNASKLQTPARRVPKKAAPK